MTQNTAQKIEIYDSQDTVIDVTSQGYARGVAIPWRAKMWIKIILSYMPLSYYMLSRLGMFRHGDISRNLSNLSLSFMYHQDFYYKKTGKAPACILELGPGDSIGHALVAKATGSQSMWLIDAGDFATQEESHYRAFFEYLQNTEKKDFVYPPKGFTREAILDFTASRYEINGLKSMSLVPDGTIDFSFSNAVFEHIARGEFMPYMRELYRAHKPGSWSRHAVDLHDHLGGALNSMRFSFKFWESRAVRKAGFYTNRLTMREMIACAEKAGFIVHIERIIKWPELPTPKTSMHDAFSHKNDDELNVCTFFMTMHKPD